MKEVKLTVTFGEANLILEGLGSLPFAKVYALVANIQEQASQQLNEGLPAEGTTGEGGAGTPATVSGGCADAE